MNIKLIHDQVNLMRDDVTHYTLNTYTEREREFIWKEANGINTEYYDT